MKKTFFCILLASFMILLTGCGKEVVEKKTADRIPTEEVELTGNDYILVASGEEMELYINPSTVTMKWLNKKTGEYKETRLFEEGIGDSTLKNDIIVSYYTGPKSAPYKTFEKMDTLTYSVEPGTVSFEKIDNGIKVVYSIANDNITYKDFPTIISDERYQELVLQYATEKQMKLLKKNYRQTQSGDWSRNTNEENPLGGLSAKQLYEAFYVTGKYTYEDLEYDDTLYDKMEDFAQHQKIQLAVDYYLDNDDLVVNLETGSLKANETMPIKNISVLPYFLSSKDSDGYLFIPDGSGALLYLDNTKNKEFQFTSRYWGGDIIQSSTTYTTVKSEMTAPVYGIKESDYAVLGIIEKGAEIATLDAYISGTFNNVPLSRVSLTFAIREDQALPPFVNALTNFTLKKVTTDYYTEDITIRYSFLTGDKANYSGMAEKYREYLTKNDKLNQVAAEEKAPIFVEMLGYVDSLEYFLGIPYNGKTTITDFASAKSILEDMNSRGIENIKVDYQGLANGGLLQRAAQKVDIASELGGEKGLSELNTYAESIGAEIYPDFQLQTANTGKGLAKNNRAFSIFGDVAQIYDFSLITHKVDETSDFPTYIISPAYIEEYLEKFRNSYNKLGLNKLASEDFLRFIGVTYKKDENVSMTTAKAYYTKELENLSNSYKLMLSNPISEAWSKVSYITDTPFEGSDLKVIDEYVPFLQMVFSGNITYSSEILNTNSFDMSEELMKTMEYGAAPKFRLISIDTGELVNTQAKDIFLAQYSTLSDIIEDMYKEYTVFYQKIKGAHLESHSLLDRDGELVKTVWSNGVTVLFNYSDKAVSIDGVNVEASSYVIK